MKQKKINKFYCPCCGQKTLDNPPGCYDICPICGWEDDPLQRKDPNYSGGANKISLNQARKNFTKYGKAKPKSSL